MNLSTKDELIQELNKSFKETTDWVLAQPKEHFNSIIHEGKWTIAGHIYHLIKSTKVVYQGMSMPKEGLQSLFGKIEHRERDYGQILTRYTETLSNTNAGSPNAYAPAAGRSFDLDTLLKRLDGERQAFIDSLSKWSEEDLSKYQLPHPFIGNLTIREFAYFTILHTYHHLNILKDRYE